MRRDERLEKPPLASTIDRSIDWWDTGVSYLKGRHVYVLADSECPAGTVALDGLDGGPYWLKSCKPQAGVVVKMGRLKLSGAAVVHSKDFCGTAHDEPPSHCLVRYSATYARCLCGELSGRLMWPVK